MSTLPTTLDGPAVANTAAPLSSSQEVETASSSQVSRAWVGGTVVLLLMGATFSNQALFGLGLILSAALFIAWAWARYCLSNLAVERRYSHTRAFWGEEVTMDHIFTNNKPLPLPWMSVEDQFPSSLEFLSPLPTHSGVSRMQRFRSVFSLGWYERVTRHYRFRCTARGEHEFGPLDITSGDIFGLFRRFATVKIPGTLLVYPRYVPIERLGIPARLPFGDYKSVQTIVTDPLRLRAVREYAYGDNPRHIHWKATARRGTLQTRLFEPSATPQLHIFVNQDTFVHMFEGLDPQTLELTITVGASVANHALEQGWMVGLQVNAFAANSDRQVKIPPSRDVGQLTRILETLARIRGWSSLPLEDLIRSQRRALPQGATIVVVTGVVTAELLNILLSLRKAGHPVTLIETLGSDRARVDHGSPASFHAQGITYYRVEAINQAETITELELA